MPITLARAALNGKPLQTAGANMGATTQTQATIKADAAMISTGCATNASTAPSNGILQTK